MTTMAALLGALPLMLGTGVGSELRHPLGITMVGGLIVSQVLTLVHHPGHLSGLRPAGPPRDRQPRGNPPGCGLRGRQGMNISATFIHRPVATTLLTLGVALAGAVAFLLLAGGAAAAGRFPDHLRAGLPARRQPGNHGLHGGHAAGTLAGAHRRHHRDHLHAVRLGTTAHHPAVRPCPQHRRRRARRAGGHQRRAQPAADRPAQQPDLPQGQPGRCADHDPVADLGYDDAAARCTTRPRPSWRRKSPRWTASAKSPSAAARCRPCASSSNPPALSQLRHRPGGRARGHRRHQCQPAQGRGRGRRAALADPRQRPGQDGGRLPAR